MATGKMICFSRQTSSRLFYYGYKILNCWLVDYKQIPNLICAFCVFFFFITAKPKQNRIVNGLAKGTFAVYIVHQVPPMESYLWNGIFHCGSWNDEVWLIPRVLFLLLLFMVIITGIDHVRMRTVEMWFMRTNWIQSMEKRIEEFYNHVYKTQ